MRRLPGFDPITFTFRKNSNYWRKSLLEVISREQILTERGKKTYVIRTTTFPPFNFKQFFDHEGVENWKN